MGLVCSLLNIYLILIFARIILSWFPVSPGGALAQIFSFLYTVTEPVLPVAPPPQLPVPAPTTMTRVLVRA